MHYGGSVFIQKKTANNFHACRSAYLYLRFFKRNILPIL
ncbi:hypothetical protein EZS27_007110 [termite gut metagenome]|uniref:Uncharacterized protein n=1 Tax=termite gut metagenome TaxID=433724 RepID=A0A5J4SGV8_9ZZZZ